LAARPAWQLDVTMPRPAAFQPATRTSRRNESMAKRNCTLAPELTLKLHDRMLLARCLEERLIQMHKQGDGFFWVGGPGEEAINASLGLLVHKGCGPEYDYLHLHYRATATLLAMGADPMDALRQMKNTASDPYSRGRNFCNHYSKRAWNVLPVSSTIGVQFSMAAGTALANKRAGGKGITIVQGGDAGTAEGDFATCLIWSSLPGRELPCLMLVTNNQWGISTPAAQMHAEKIASRADAFGIRNAVVDGNDVQTCYNALAHAMDYVRTTQRPFLLEAHVSRLHGHTSASGANRVTDEVDCLELLENRIEASGLMSRDRMHELRARYTHELRESAKRVCEEAQPRGEDIYRDVFATRDLVHGL
jgi:2-oxoisovalerate dehydrogenase E1 component alpha subunit